MRWVVFLAVVFSVLALMTWVAGQRIVQSLALPPGQSRWVWVAVVLLSASTLFSFVTRGSEVAAIRWVAWLGYPWLGFLFLFFIAGIAQLLPQAALWGAAKVGMLGDIEPARRDFLSRAVAMGFTGVATLAGAWGMWSVRPPVLVTRHTARTKKAWQSDRPFRIVQLTDIHVGKTVRAGFIDGIVRQVNALDADIVVITGDLVDGSVSALGPIVARLSNLRSRFGSYFVTGNHEYYSGAREWVAFLREQGITVLENEGRIVGEGSHRVSLAGVNDLHAHGSGTPDPKLACADCDSSLPLVMLAHQPKQFFDALPFGIDLMLSGHTHGGQIFPFNYLVKLQQPFTAGLHEHDGAQIYVSRGTGYWGPPMRLGAPAEIAVIEVDGV